MVDQRLETGDDDQEDHLVGQRSVNSERRTEGADEDDALVNKPLADVEKHVILTTLERFKGHRMKTAHALGIGVRTLGMKLKKWKDEGELVESHL
jgi:DNA-binding NtrC family response regulator